MTPLAQTALDFCRECLGWEQASSDFSPDGVIWNGESRERMADFHYTDLNAVMDAVRGWCRRNQLGITIGVDDREFEVMVYSVEIDEVDEEATHDTLQEALLAACVEASRKLKTTG